AESSEWRRSASDASTARARRTNRDVADQSFSGMAIGSLICAIVGAIAGPLAVILGPIAVILGVQALSGMKASDNRAGYGLAKAGIIVGAIVLAIGLVV